MTIPNLFPLDKYQDSGTYREVVPGVYRNLAANNYCMCFYADSADQYPMKRLLEMYRLAFVQGYSRKRVTVNGTDKIAMEVETKDDSLQSLIRLLHFATVPGKEVLNYAVGGCSFLCVRYCDTDCTVNGMPVRVPLLGCREDMWGDTDFEPRYPEYQFRGQFTGGQDFVAPQLPANTEFRAVILRDSFAYVLYLENHRTNKALMFNQQRYLAALEDWALTHALRSEFDPNC